MSWMPGTYEPIKCQEYSYQVLAKRQSVRDSRCLQKTKCQGYQVLMERQRVRDQGFQVLTERQIVRNTGCLWNGKVSGITGVYRTSKWYMSVLMEQRSERNAWYLKDAKFKNDQLFQNTKLYYAGPKFFQLVCHEQVIFNLPFRIKYV